MRRRLGIDVRKEGGGVCFMGERRGLMGSLASNEVMSDLTYRTLDHKKTKSPQYNIIKSRITIRGTVAVQKPRYYSHSGIRQPDEGQASRTYASSNDIQESLSHTHTNTPSFHLNANPARNTKYTKRSKEADYSPFFAEPLSHNSKPSSAFSIGSSSLAFGATPSLDMRVSMSSSLPLPLRSAMKSSVG